MNIKGKGSIRVGNQTAFSVLDPEEPFLYAASNGFNAFEWFPDKKESGAGWTIHDFYKSRRRRLKAIARDYDIRISIHVANDMDFLRPLDITNISEHISFACDMGASLFNIHFQDAPIIHDIIRLVRPRMNEFNNHHFQLAIENTPLTGPSDFNELFKHIRSQLSKDDISVGMCLDLGHANLCSATQNDYLRFMDLLDPEIPIIHIHAHENYGDFDSHLPLFTGPSGKDVTGIHGVMERLMKRQFSGCLILEQWPQPHSLLNIARERLISIWENL